MNPTNEKLCDHWVLFDSAESSDPAEAVPGIVHPKGESRVNVANLTGHSFVVRCVEAFRGRFRLDAGLCQQAGTSAATLMRKGCSVDTISVLAPRFDHHRMGIYSSTGS